MDIQKLLQQFMDWFQETTITKPCKDGFHKIAVPLVDHLNDGLEIYIREQNEQIDITDDGYIIANLEMSGVVLDEGDKREYINSIVRKNGLELKNDEIWAHTTADKFPVVLLVVLQTMLAIDNLYDLRFYLRKNEEGQSCVKNRNCSRNEVDGKQNKRC